MHGLKDTHISIVAVQAWDYNNTTSSNVHPPCNRQPSTQITSAWCFNTIGSRGQEDGMHPLHVPLVDALLLRRTAIHAWCVVHKHLETGLCICPSGDNVSIAALTSSRGGTNGIFSFSCL
mmetsp:Transcript_17672/g.49295  ORF Transcript_17672/g.49295 Transcript_17672/m.49295 type:complete len:120 (-) Transcript_17672:2169-2528(-)